MFSNQPPKTPVGMSVLQKIAVAALAVLLVGSVAARAAFLTSQPTTTSGSGSSAALEPSNYLASSTQTPPAAAPEQQPGALEHALPYVTEASFFGLIGFALGYATRKLFKLALLLLALAFIAIQTLTHFNLMHVEWGPVVSWINARVLNLKESGTVTEFLTKRVPSIGTLLVGWWLGFRRG